MKLQNTGKVIFAAAGPGDPELITIKAARYLKEADVILTDRLVSENILKNYSGLHTKIVYVGKQCGQSYSLKQADINILIAEYALQGKLVVRLKGGDSTLFSNILDELRTVVKHRIPYEIIPGVTSALGAAAYAGIPLTARGYSTSVRMVTTYDIDSITETTWKELADTNDTLVFYMSSSHLPELVKQLVKNKIDENKKLAVIEQATTPAQQVYIANLYEYVKTPGRTQFTSPSLIIIGKVVSLHERFNWFVGNESEEYFKPLHKVLTGYSTIN
jgi:uroporphyrin-III C-methyltransferase